MNSGIAYGLRINFPYNFTKNLEQIMSTEETLAKGLIPIGEPKGVIGRANPHYGGFVKVPEKIIPAEAKAYVAGKPVIDFDIHNPFD